MIQDIEARQGSNHTCEPRFQNGHPSCLGTNAPHLKSECSSHGARMDRRDKLICRSWAGMHPTCGIPDSLILQGSGHAVEQGWIQA